MLNFVCGTLFGSGSGRIHDIVLDWEDAGPEEIAQIEIAAENDPASMLDADNYRNIRRHRGAARRP